MRGGPPWKLSRGLLRVRAMSHHASEFMLRWRSDIVNFDKTGIDKCK